MTEFNFGQDVVEVGSVMDPFQVERELREVRSREIIRGIGATRQPARAIADADPGRLAHLPAAKAGGGGQGSTGGVAREVPTEAASAERLIARWKSEPNLHAEFGCFARFAAYEKAVAAGRARIFTPQQNRRQKPQQADRRWRGV